MRNNTAKINTDAFRRLAARIAAEPQEYDQGRWYEDPTKRRGNCGSACCVMGHAAMMAGARMGLTTAIIAYRQRDLACGELGVESGEKKTERLFGWAWPVEWFTQTQAADRNDLVCLPRQRKWNAKGVLELAEPLSGEAVKVLLWIANNSRLPGENRKSGSTAA